MRPLEERARSFLSDAYCKVRHYAGKADDLLAVGAAGYRVAAPFVAAAVDASGASDTTKLALGAVKQGIDRGLQSYERGRGLAELAGHAAESVLY